MGVPHKQHPQVFVIVHPVYFINSRHRGNLGVYGPPVGLRQGGPINKIKNILSFFPGGDAIIHIVSLAYRHYIYYIFFMKKV
jgi:hypothetical protein